jgi:PAS domain S-box-containing protein
MGLKLSRVKCLLPMQNDHNDQMDATSVMEGVPSEKSSFACRERHRHIFSNISQGCAYCQVIFEEDRPVDFMLEVVNQGFETMIGIKELEGLKISDVIPGFARANSELFERLARVTQSGVAERCACYINILNKWFDISLYSQSKSFFVLVLTPMKTINTGIWEWNLETGKMVISDELRMLFGLHELSSEPFYEVWRRSIVQCDRVYTEQEIHASIAKFVKFRVVCRICCSDGIIRRLMHQGVPSRNSDGIGNRYTIICTDVTEYKNEDIAFQINKINLNTTLNICMDPFCSLALDGTILDSNKYFNDSYAKEGEILTGQNFHKRFPCHFSKERKARFDLVFYTGKSIYYQEKCLGINECAMECGECLNQIAVYPVYGKSDEIESVVVFLTKSNKEKESEEVQKQLDQKYQTLIAASPDSIITTNLQGIITSISDMGIGLYGTNDSGELIGIPFSSLVHSSDLKNLNKILEIALCDGLIQNREILMKKKNKTIYSAEISAALIQDYNGDPSSYMIIIRDISQRKIIESELFHAKRLISLGEMASGIAHEIYQPINNIGLIVDRLIMDAMNNNWPCEKSIKKKSDKIFENILRVQTIIDNIRSFSSTDNNYISSVVSINKSIKNALLMFAEQCKHKSILLDFKAKYDNLSVTGNMYNFEQVILNLIKNSIDALEEKKQHTDSGFEMKILVESRCENDSVIVSIEDNGIGISPENIEYIMHPFYTTKESGKGTGLGLSISYGIIKEMNGDIKIRSTLMQGTCVIISLPNKAKQ